MSVKVSITRRTRVDTLIQSLSARQMLVLKGCASRPAVSRVQARERSHDDRSGVNAARAQSAWRGNGVNRKSSTPRPTSSATASSPQAAPAIKFLTSPSRCHVTYTASRCDPGSSLRYRSRSDFHTITCTTPVSPSPRRGRLFLCRSMAKPWRSCRSRSGSIERSCLRSRASASNR